MREEVIRLSKDVEIRLPGRSYTKYPKYVAYGAANVLAEYARVHYHVDPLINGIWQHGWHPSFWRLGSEYESYSGIVSGAIKKKLCDIYVARRDQERCLRSDGFRRTQAIGLPIIYAHTKSERIPKSLLVMPPHLNHEASHKWRCDDYAKYIEDIKDDFDVVAACVGASTKDREEPWVSTFREIGITVIAGADFRDRSSLSRMANLFSYFEYMTTNAFGSHIAYAAYFGAKVSVYGHIDKIHAAGFKGGFYDKYPGITKKLVDAVNGVFDSDLKWLRVDHPLEGHYAREWAMKELGADCKVSKEEAAKLLLDEHLCRLYWTTRDVYKRMKHAFGLS